MPGTNEMDGGGKYDSLRPKSMSIDYIIYLEVDGEEPELVFYGTDARGLSWSSAIQCEAASVVPGFMSDTAAEAVKAIDADGIETREEVN